MAFSSTITITGSTNITNFDIFQCPTSGCTGCVAITGSTGENVSRMKLLTGHTVSVDQGYRYIKLVADTATCNNSICMEVIGIPTYTPTPTSTPTPTPTPTATNVPNSTSTPTPTPTATAGPTSTPTPTGPTNTPTPTPTATSTPTPTPTPVCAFGVDIAVVTTGVKSLQIYAKDVYSLPQNLTLFYKIGSSGNINVPGATGTALSSTCSLKYTITGLTANDVITFGTSLNCGMTGAQGTSCPSYTSINTTYQYTMDTGTVQAVGIALDSSQTS